MRTRVLARAGVIAGTALLAAAAGFAGLAQAHAVTAMTMPVMGPGAVTRALPAHMPGGMLMPVRASSATLRRCDCCPGSDSACCTGGPTGAAVVRCCRGDDDSAMGAVALLCSDHARVGCCPTACACNCPCGACGGDALA